MFPTLLLLMTTCFAAPLVQVKNGMLPEQPRTLIFEEDLRFGSEQGEDVHLWSSSSITPDANQQGDIFVTDPGGNRIVQFDKNGKLIRQIGRQGQGPGEFQILSSFKLLQDGSGLAFDNQQVAVTFSHFDSQMNFVDRDSKSSFGMVIQSAIFSNDARYMGSFYMIPNDEKTIQAYTGLIATKDFKPVKVLTETTLDRFNPARLEDPTWWGPYTAKWFAMVTHGIGVFAAGPQNSLFTAISTNYEITKWDQDLKQVMVIKRDYKPIPRDMQERAALADPIRDELMSILPAQLQGYMTRNVVDKGLALAEMRPVKPPIYWIFAMEDSSLVVIHKYDAVTGISIADLFSPKGEYLGQTQLPRIKVNFFGSVFGNNTKMVFRNGFCYAIEDLEKGVDLVRYRYRWVDAKKGS